MQVQRSSAYVREYSDPALRCLWKPFRNDQAILIFPTEIQHYVSNNSNDSGLIVTTVASEANQYNCKMKHFGNRTSAALQLLSKYLRGSKLHRIQIAKLKIHDVF